MNAFDAAEKNGKAGDLQKELEVLFNNQNKSPGTNTTSIPATFLRVTVGVHNRRLCDCSSLTLRNICPSPIRASGYRRKSRSPAPKSSCRAGCT
jgi:hypothetical protein